MAVVSEIVTKFSFVGSLSKLDNFNTGLGKGIGLLGAFIVSVKAISIGILLFTARVLNSIEPIAYLSKEVGVSVEKLQELGYAASVSGSSIDAMNTTLASFSRRVGDAALGGASLAYFKRLKINIRDASGQIKSADKLLLEVGGSMRGLPSAEQLNMARRLGIDKSVIALITSSDEAIDGLTSKARALGIVTAEQADLAVAASDALSTTKFAMNALKQQIALGFAPQLKKVSDWMTQLLIDNKDLIQNGIKKFVNIITNASDAVGRLLPILKYAAIAFVLLKIATIGLGAVFKVVFSPIVIISAAILSVLLIVDDLIVAFKGGNSVIRDFFLEFFGWDIAPVLQGLVALFFQIIGNIKEAFGNLVDAVKLLFSVFAKILRGDLVGAVDDFWGVFQKVGAAIKNLFGGIFKFIAGKIKNIIPDKVLKFVGLSAKSESGNLYVPTDGRGYDVPLDDTVTRYTQPSVLNSSSSNSETNVTQNITVNARDEKAAVSAIRGGLTEGLITADVHNSRGGM